MAKENEIEKREMKNRAPSVIVPMMMYSDCNPERQPESTYRFALNGVMEDRETLGRLQNEESNEECIELGNLNVKGEVLAALCCGQLVKFEYTASDIASKISGLTIDCEEYSHTGYWRIDGEGHYTTAELETYLAGNIGTHRIVAECESTKIYIKVVNCCKTENETYITAYGSMQITSQFVTDMFNQCKTPYIVNDDGNGNVVSINGTSYTMAQLPIEVSADSIVTILCSEYNPCDVITSIEPVSEYTNDDLTTATITQDGEGYISIFHGDTLSSPGSLYVAFESEACFTYDMGIAININGVLIPYNPTYDDSISSYWYIDDNCHIIVKLEVEKSNNYNFKFDIKDNCGTPLDLSLNIAVRIKVYDTLGVEVGYIDPTSLIMDMSTQAVVLDGVSGTGIVGRTYDQNGNIVDSYYVATAEGEVVELATEDMLVDARHNSSIIIKPA